MRYSLNLEYIKQAMIDCFESHKLNHDEIEKEFDSDYKMSWDKDFDVQYSHLVDSIKAFESAKKENDKAAQKALLILARVIAHGISSLFEDLMDDLEKTAFSEKFNFPKLPEGYKIPEDYYINSSLKDIL